MKFGADLVNEASEIIRLAFGADWLANQALPRDTGDAWGARSHPIGNALGQADRQGVALILELAQYLKFLAPMPSYGTVVAGLKADFRSTFLQLSFAQRVSGLGGRDLVLEPPVEGGRLGDVAFVLSGQEFVAECYVQRAARWTTSTEGMWLLRRIVKVLDHRSLSLCVAIQLKKPLDAALRKELLASARRLVGQVESSPGEPLLEARTEWVVSVVNSGPGGALLLHPGFPTGVGEPLMGMNSRMVERAHVEAVAANPAVPFQPSGPLYNRVALWADLSDEQEHSISRDLERPLGRLAKRLRAKRAQTKRPGARRLLLCESWVSRELRRATDEQLERFGREALGPSEFVGCLVFLDRTWDQRARRHRVNFFPHYSSPPDSACVELVAKLLVREREALNPPILVGD
jgi:hypothetical protein